MQRIFRRALMASSLALAAAFIGQSANADPFGGFHWESVIGIAQLNNVVGSGTGAVTGGGVPWSALAGDATVDPVRGRLSFRVRGLVLAGGNFIGTPGTTTQVRGTLVCDTDGSATGGNSVLVDTPLVQLGDLGDATFSGTLGPLPAVCATEPDVAFLVRLGSGRWIANATVLH
jgi:polyisoprenoid-binding protein YceI